MKNTSHFVLWITVLSIGFFTILLPVQAQTEWIEIKRGTGTLDGANPSWTFFTVNLSEYSSGNLTVHIFVEGGTGISRTGGKCWGGAQFAEEGFFQPENKNPSISNLITRLLVPNQRTVINGNFSKPTKFILGVIPTCKPGISSKFEYVIYIKNGKKASEITSALSSNCKSKSLPPIPPELERKIAKLSSLAQYKERAETYVQIHREIQKRGIKIGFFRAASVVTLDFSLSLDLEQPAQDYLDQLSKDLAGINTKYILELLKTGRLEKEDKTGCFIMPEEIDSELVRREQQFAENKLSKLKDRKKIVEIINARIKLWLDKPVLNKLSGSITAIDKVRDNKRKTNNKAEFDFGNIKDRISVGKILAENFRFFSR
ncbi:MAG TPA: hypothetical protein VF721_09040 [Pyrinomonadaceae bacterium]|jgi:hypothetical protein